MVDQQSLLSIVVETINNASEGLKQVEKDLGLLSDSADKGATAFAAAGDKQGQAIKDYEQYLGEFNKSLSDLNKELASVPAASGKLESALGGISMESVTAALKLAGVTLAITALIKQMGEAVKVAGRVESSLIAVAATARMFGEDATTAKEAAKSLAEDGLITEAKAAEGLQEIMSTGLGLEEAIVLMERFKDVAAFGGKGTIEYTDKIRMLYESFKTGYGIQAKNAGLIMTWNDLMDVGAEKLGKKTDELTLAEEAMAKYLGVMEVTAGEEGQASLVAETHAGSVTTLKNAKIDLMNTIGQGLLPVMTAFNNTLATVIGKLGGLKVVTQAISTVFQGLQFIAGEVGNFISGQIATIINSWRILIEEASKITLDPRTWLEAGKGAIERFGRETTEIWKEVKDDAIQIAIDSQIAIEKTWEKGTGDITDVIDEAANDWLNSMSEAARRAAEQNAKAYKKMMEDFIKENARYQRAVEKRTKQFEESFDDLVIAHRDAIESLTADLGEEAKDYKDKVTDLLGDYTEAVEEMEERHHKKTESVLEDMEDERRKTEEVIDEITKKYNESTTLIEREGEARLNNLEAQLAKEEALGDNSDKDKIAALKQMIAYEESGMAGTLDEKKEKYDEEIAKVEDILREKLEKLQKELDEENSIYSKSFAKRKAQYDEDVINAKESYEAKREKLDEELDKELKIREKYADDFRRIGDKLAEDDLTRLIRKHDEEMVELLRAHEEQVAEIGKRGFEAGAELIDGFSDGIESNYPRLQNQLNQIGADVNKVTSKFENVGQSLQGGGLGDLYTPASYLGGSQVFGQYGGVFSRPTIVGESGAELVLPLNFPKRMADLMRSSGIGQGGMGEVTQNFYVTVTNQQDVDVLMERAGFALQQGGGSK